jgi:hypothetical protein
LIRKVAYTACPSAASKNYFESLFLMIMMYMKYPKAIIPMGRRPTRNSPKVHRTQIAIMIPVVATPNKL